MPENVLFIHFLLSGVKLTKNLSWKVKPPQRRLFTQSKKWSLKSELQRNRKFIIDSKEYSLGLLITFTSKIFTSVILNSLLKYTRFSLNEIFFSGFTEPTKRTKQNYKNTNLPNEIKNQN